MSVLAVFKEIYTK